MNFVFRLPLSPSAFTVVIEFCELYFIRLARHVPCPRPPPSSFLGDGSSPYTPSPRGVRPPKHKKDTLHTPGKSSGVVNNVPIDGTHSRKKILFLVLS